MVTGSHVYSQEVPEELRGYRGSRLYLYPNYVLQVLQHLHQLEWIQTLGMQLTSRIISKLEIRMKSEGSESSKSGWGNFKDQLLQHYGQG